MTEKNLAGIRVLDFTRVLAGPYLTQMLCDLGAEVIKIEQPGKGADERAFSPIVKGQSGYYMMLNRGKKSITLNLKDPKAKEIVFELAKKSDIITENFKPGVMDSLGFSYEAFKKVKPDIIMCSISTFGQKGPYSQRVGYDIVAQAMSGLMWMTGDPDRPPTRSGTSIGDVNASAHALGAIGAALYYREKTGKGQYIDISMRDCLTAIIETAIPRYTMSGGQDKPMRSGRHHATMAPYGVFDAGRGNYIVLGALNQAIWTRLCTAMNRPEMIDDPRYNTPTARAENLSDVVTAIETWLQSFADVNEALHILEVHEVPSAPVLNIEQLLQDPQLLMRDMIIEVNDPIFGEVKLPATPMRFSETTVINTTPAPLLGQHTEEVLKTLVGMTDAEIEALRQNKVI
ncbi:L-carnitine dehydratase/bile acid-inducible protein F [Thermosinus carboxydivorans Nor1]|uniref:L-carnitine dehydratase/bile acid-inducible protein F n=1 Tax=Thermosinus carboxydivorans Nor1 TaxID=401526 RepID=A1HSG9_9FIRM|nr:CaiB/BaiF CoA-transferase family protein [Thermosinus carboxydivorans]EAX47032.1 L-carnitine dehydratase/bile acid-inducible protein F [Thermosinus carboxydivorans Nor1]